MKKIFTFLLSLFLLQGVFAQNQNALDFDGIDDQVIVPNGASLITSGSGISLGMWVYPRNSAPGFPNLDCFGGIRNNVDADFYMIQISASSIEARFRNSSGINFDIVYNGLLLNTWQHFVFTYDGTATKLFHNGVEVSSVSANGSITNSSETLYVGNGLYQGTEFTMDGKADDVVLFDRAVTQQEVNCFYRGSVDTTLSGLKLYYNCNQGIADGNNAGLTTLNGLSGQPAGTLANFALSGTGSNWVSGMNFTGTETASICSGDTYNLGGQSFSSAGTYLVTVPGSGGCDSTVSLTLSLLQVDTSVIRINTQLTTTGLADSYQWVNCNNNFAIIPGATQANYNVTVDGTYAVIITDGNCVDTSRCVSMSVESIRENIRLNPIAIWPNPAADFMMLDNLENTALEFYILDASGKQVHYGKLMAGAKKQSIDLSSLNNGIYLLKTVSMDGNIGTGKFTIVK